MTPQSALAALEALGDAQKATDMAAYHKAPRRYLGVANPVIDALAKEWRAEVTLAERLALAQGLWDTDVFEARIAAAKLMTQARIRPDDTAAWEMIASWVPDFDSWAIADAVSSAGARRLTADPTRLDTVEAWTTSEHMWTRRAALVMTLPWAKLPHPKPADIAARNRILGWAADYKNNPEWFIQKAIAWWLRDLSKHDANCVTDFLKAHGNDLAPFALKEASKRH